MRADMHKILVEQPRFRSSDGYPRNSKSHTRPLGEMPTHEPLGRNYRSKSLSENLAPLRRFLRSRVGLRWDRVYAEVRARVGGANPIQQHILQHLFDYVVLHVDDVDGVLYRATGRTRFDALSYMAARARLVLYVCPRTGVLRQVDRPRRTAPTRDPRFRRVSDTVWWMLRAAGWFEVEVAPLPRGAAPRDRLFDVITRDFIDGARHRDVSAELGLPWADSHFVVRTRQLGKRDIRAQR